MFASEYSRNLLKAEILVPVPMQVQPELSEEEYDTIFPKSEDLEIILTSIFSNSFSQTFRDYVSKVGQNSKPENSAHSFLQCS